MNNLILPSNGRTDLPANVYRLPQRRFDAIPGSPWVYWVSDSIRELFERLPNLGEVAQPRQGLATADNFRFLRYWWETGAGRIAFGCQDRDEARAGGKRWFPYMKGGAFRRWYGNQEYTVNWAQDGKEIRNFYDSPGDRPASRPQNTDYYFRQGITWGDLNPTGFAVRYSPGGFVFDVKGSSGFPMPADMPVVMAIMNSNWTQYALGMLNPTASFQVGDISRVPIAPPEATASLAKLAKSAIQQRLWESALDEATFDFIAPPRWDTGIADQATAAARLAALEAQINDEVYRLYGISDADRAAIEAELRIDDSRLTIDDSETGADDALGEDAEALIENRKSEIANREELAVRWISYAVGVVLGRFQPGVSVHHPLPAALCPLPSALSPLPAALGSAIYHRDDFAIGSLPAPDEAEFDELVGPPERFAYVDAEGGRHVFSPEVEQALCDLALPDGLAVLDEGHPRDLPTLVERALGLMLGEGESQIIDQVGGDLRAFLSKDFFTRWHLRWYRKRPVYWPLQSGKRSYGFVLFHERVDRLTLYTLQRDYLDYKLNAVRQQVTDLNQAAAMQTGATRRATEREAAKTAALLDELTEFARTMERIVRGGYEPEPNWIDDGVILRLAPLWELLPLWKAEPKKYWERLARGDFDWSHIAMKYWPARVRAACQVNKSFAIAHGREEWYGEQ